MGLTDEQRWYAGRAVDRALPAAALAGEGAIKIRVVTDDTEKYPSGSDFASGVRIFAREDLEQSQRELRDTPGLTFLVYDQTCAAEKRRRRQRGLYPDPPRRVFIMSWPSTVRGYGHVKDRSLAETRVRLEMLREKFAAPAAPQIVDYGGQAVADLQPAK